MTRAKADVVSSLQRKGFQRDNRDHSYFIYWNTAGQKTPRKTKVSHGSAKYKELGEPLIKAMAKQCGLTKQKFLELVDCTLDQNGYENCFSEIEFVESTTHWDTDVIDPLIKDRDWTHIDGELCRVVRFESFATVDNGRIDRAQPLLPYASIELECGKLAP